MQLPAAGRTITESAEAKRHCVDKPVGGADTQVLRRECAGFTRLATVLRTCACFAVRPDTGRSLSLISGPAPLARRSSATEGAKSRAAQDSGAWRLARNRSPRPPYAGAKRRNGKGRLKMTIREFLNFAYGVSSWESGPSPASAVRAGARTSRLRPAVAAQCLLRFEDLSGFRAERTEPVHINYKGYDIYAAAPNSQGAVLLLVLKILEGFDLRSMG